MGKTIAEKILSEKSGTDVAPGDVVKVEYDLAASHDGTTPQTIERFEEWEGTELADPGRLALVPDHYVPSHTPEAKHLYNRLEEFAEEHDVEHFYPLSETGLMHTVLPDDGLVKPGDVVVGADSHTVTYGALGAFGTGVGFTDLAFAWAEGWVWLRVPETVRIDYRGDPEAWVRGKDLVLRTLAEIGVDGAVYKAIEFGGPLVEKLPMDDRFSISNMSVEAGAKTGLFEPDDTIRSYVDERVNDEYTLYESDDDASYGETLAIDCEGLEPQVAVPNSPSNAKPVSDVTGVDVDQAVVGSCVNCREEDLRLAAEVLDGREVHPDVRMIVTPGSREIQLTALEAGWIRTFMEAGADLGNPGCGACFGETIGALDEGETAIATTNRNFVGRMGPESSEVYLSNPAVAAASAVAGEIVHPGEVV